jgi:hypothetical protein
MLPVGRLVLVARDGDFIPSGKNDRSHRDAALLAGLRGAEAGSMAAVMFERRGH